MMSIIKSFSVTDINGQPGDMFYIQHNSNNFTIIDCCLNDKTQDSIVEEIIDRKSEKNITRVISTHPDEDHICGLGYLDDKINILNFYCVENSATKENESDSFKHYCRLRDDSKKSFYVYKGCKRKWLNDSNESDPKDNGGAGINFLWPITSNGDYKDALRKAHEGTKFNNISPIFTYSLSNGVKAMWMGDIEKDFLERVKDNIDWPEIDILFAPHHGRDNGKVPTDILKSLNPMIIVIGEAKSEELNYYTGYNTITQNSAKDITFSCETGKVHVYVSNDGYSVDYLSDEKCSDCKLGYYLGSFVTKEPK